MENTNARNSDRNIDTAWNWISFDHNGHNFTLPSHLIIYCIKNKDTVVQRTVSWLVKEVCLDKRVKSIYSGLGPKWSTSVIATRMEESNNNKSKTELHIRVCISVYLLWYFSSHISSAFSLILQRLMEGCKEAGQPSLRLCAVSG